MERKGKTFYIPKDKGGVYVVGRQHDLVSHTFIVTDLTVTVVFTVPNRVTILKRLLFIITRSCV